MNDEFISKLQYMLGQHGYNFLCSTNQRYTNIDFQKALEISLLLDYLLEENAIPQELIQGTNFKSYFDVEKNGIKSITGAGVNNSDPENIILTFPTSGQITEDTNKNFVTDANLVVLGNTSGTNTGDQDISGIAINAGVISTLEEAQTTQNTAIALNTAKTGITTEQASEITANTAKAGITSQLALDIAANTAKVGISTAQANEITVNTAKVSYPGDQDISGIGVNASAITDLENEQITQNDAIALNTAKRSYPLDDENRLANISGINTGDQGAPNVTLDDTNLVVAKKTNVQDFAEKIDSAVLRARGTGVSTTYVSTVDVGGTTFNQGAVTWEVSSDEGYFSNNGSAYSNLTVTNLSAPSTYVYYDKNNVLQQQTSIPTRQDWSRKVFTMRIALDLSTNTIIDFEYLNNPIGHYANSIRDVYSYLLAQGVPFKQDQIITGRATDLGFDVSAGSLMEFGGTGDINNANIKLFDLVENATFFLATRTSFDAGTNTDLPKFWDNNGVLTALGSTTLVGHRLYRFSNGNLVMQYGQGNYANMALAESGVILEDYVLNPILKNATFFGWWFIESTATNTGGTTLTKFKEYTLGIQGGSSSGLSGCVLRGNNGSDFLDISETRTNLGINTTVNQTDSADKRFVTDAELVVIGNTSGTNTGDETTASIQTKRPLKTINSESLEGSGNIVISGGSGISGSGTVNRVPKFTPNGSTLGDSQIFDNGTSVGIGTVSPSASYKLNVNGVTKIGNTVYNDPQSHLIVGIDGIVGLPATRLAIANASNYQDAIFVNTSISDLSLINSWSFGQRRDTYFGNSLGSFQIVGAHLNNSGSTTGSTSGLRVPLICNANGDIILAGALNATNGNVGIGVASLNPTEKLDVDGSARIRTIANLGATPTEVLVPSATGVVSKRTVTEFKSDLGLDGYVESDTTGVTGADQVLNMISLTQAEYDAITPVATTFYIITD